MDYEEDDMTLATFVSLKKKELAKEKKKKEPMTTYQTEGYVPLYEGPEVPFYGGPSSDEEINEEVNREIYEKVDEEINEDINNDFIEETGEEEVKRQGRVRRRTSKRSQQELIRILMSMNFVGTRYPHNPTMKELSILADVEFMMKNCNLDTFFTYNFEGYKEETCHFLASLDVHLYEHEEDFDPTNEGLGYITFEIRGQPFSLTFEAIDKLFGFSRGTEVRQDFDKAELTDVWRVISGNDAYSSARSKSSHIGNPAIRYFHKCLANTFFARRVTGNINEGELQFLNLALRDLLNQTTSLRIMEGDRSQTGLTTVLVDQLLQYKYWAVKMHNMGTKGDLCIGGIITPFLYACGVDLTSRSVEPRWMDKPYLTKAQFLVREQGDGTHLYRFLHPVEGDSKLALPNPRLTKMRQGNNITFNPPVEFLFRKIAQEEADNDEQRSNIQPEEHTSASSELEKANKKIGILERISRWQGKKIKGLKNTVKEIRGQLKELQQIVSCSSTRPDAQRPMPMERSRSSSAEFRRHPPMEPARSSYTHHKRQGESSHPHSTSPLDQHVESDHPPATTTSPPQITSDMTMPLDHDANSNTPQVEYTKESMEEAISSFFSNP